MGLLAVFSQERVATQWPISSFAITSVSTRNSLIIGNTMKHPSAPVDIWYILILYCFQPPSPALTLPRWSAGNVLTWPCQRTFMLKSLKDSFVISSCSGCNSTAQYGTTWVSTCQHYTKHPPAKQTNEYHIRTLKHHPAAWTEFPRLPKVPSCSLIHPPGNWGSQIFSFTFIVIITFQLFTLLHLFCHFPRLAKETPWAVAVVTYYMRRKPKNMFPYDYTPQNNRTELVSLTMHTYIHRATIEWSQSSFPRHLTGDDFPSWEVCNLGMSWISENALGHVVLRLYDHCTLCLKLFFEPTCKA